MKSRTKIFKKSVIFLALLATVVNPSVIHAEENSDTQGGIRNRIMLMKEELKEKKEERVEERTENREERREEFAKKHAERLTKRFSQYYERLTKIIAKIKARVADNTEAKAKLAEAEAKLSEAKKLGEEAVDMFEALKFGNLGSNKEEVELAKNKADEARIAFMDTMKLAKDAIKLAKGNLNDE